jgi:hypothetical protein
MNCSHHLQLLAKGLYCSLTLCKSCCSHFPVLSLLFHFNNPTHQKEDFSEKAFREIPKLLQSWPQNSKDCITVMLMGAKYAPF